MRIGQRIVVALVGVLLFAAPQISSAASSSSAPFNTASDRCSAEINGALAREVRLYRTVLFGHKEAETAHLGDTRYDFEGNPWMKVEEDTWRTSVNRFKHATRTDLQMDTQEEHDPFAQTSIRRGILETRKVLTSELLPPVLQSFRALRCRAAVVCANARKTFEQSGFPESELYTLQPLGCIEFTDVRPLFQCQLGREKDPDGTSAHQGDQGYLLNYCEQMTAQLLNREAAFLKLTIAYDAAYRSLLQFTGHFDQFLHEFQSSLLLPVRQAVTLLGNLHKIPCFLSQCDE